MVGGEDVWMCKELLLSGETTLDGDGEAGFLLPTARIINGWMKFFSIL